MSRATFAICIPTFNRAEILRETLIALSAQQEVFDELVISDNASPDHTQAVIEECRPLFRRLIAIRQPENIGLWRNLNACLSISRARYQYFLSDDDRILTSGIASGLALLQQSPDAAAVYGGLRRIDHAAGESIDVTYTDAPICTTRPGMATIAEHFLWIQNPIMSAEAYQRFCNYNPMAFCQWRLYDGLLNAGPVWFAPGCFYEHLATPGRAELAVQEPWYYTYNLSDIDFMLANADFGADGPDHEERLGRRASIRKLHESTFLKAAYQDARRRGLVFDQWRNLMRLRAVGGQVQALEEDWDRECLIQAARDRVIEQAFVTQRKRLYIEVGALNVAALIGPIQAAMPELDIVPLEWSEFIAIDCASDEALLAEDWTTIQNREPTARDDGLRWAFSDFMRNFALAPTNASRVIQGPEGSVHLSRV